MLLNLLEATKKYWRKLDQLEAAYQQNEIPLEEVNAKVTELMTELAQERRAAFNYFWHGWQHWLMTQRETIVGLAIVVLATYAWVLTSKVP